MNINLNNKEIKLPFKKKTELAEYLIDIENNGSFKISVKTNNEKKIKSWIFVDKKEAFRIIPLIETKLLKNL